MVRCHVKFRRCIYFYSVCMSFFSACMFVFIHAWCPQKPEENTRTLRTKITGGCELPRGYWTLNPDILQNHWDISPAPLLSFIYGARPPSQLPIMDWVSYISEQSRDHPTDKPTGQNMIWAIPLLRLPSPVTLGCVKLMLKACRTNSITR